MEVQKLVMYVVEHYDRSLSTIQYNTSASLSLYEYVVKWLVVLVPASSRVRPPHTTPGSPGSNIVEANTSSFSDSMTR